MQIIIVSNGKIPHIGGKSTHIMDLKNGLEELGNNVCIISDTSISKLIMNLYRLILLPVRIVNKYRYIHYMKILLSRYLARMCCKYESDIIIAQDAVAASGLCGNKRLNNIPKYLTMHTYFGIENMLDGKNISKKIYNNMMEYELKCLEQIDGIICVDKRIRRTVEGIVSERKQGRLKDRISDIANFTNTNKFKPVSTDIKNSLRKKHDVKEDAFVCVCARRLVEKNGVMYAVQAMKHLGDDCILLIAGNGPEREKIVRYIADNNLESKVRLLNNIPNDNICELYQLADVSLVPSITVQGLQEATSITAIEGMACGIPTIASNIGGLAQMIDNVKTGILVEEANADKIADAIVTLMNNNELYNIVSSGARMYIEKNHSHIQGAKNYLDAYNQWQRIEQ